MHLANPEGVYFCLLGERAIFLDANRDRYFASSVDAAAALSKAIEGGVNAIGVESAIQPLLSAGLVTQTSDPSRALRTTNVKPARNEWPNGFSAGLIPAAIALGFQFRTILALRRRGLAQELKARQTRGKRKRSNIPANTIVCAHRVSNFLFSAHERCLSKSLALYDMLGAAGYEPRLMLGVRDYPFGAHAWVELEDAVVSDHADHVAIYQPIMVL